MRSYDEIERDKLFYRVKHDRALCLFLETETLSLTDQIKDIQRPLFAYDKLLPPRDVATRCRTPSVLAACRNPDLDSR